LLAPPRQRFIRWCLAPLREPIGVKVIAAQDPP
jgi:hypothetical protein